MSKPLRIIDEIEEVRRHNNINWMDILRLCFKHAPEETRSILRKVSEDDKKVNTLLEELCKDEKP